MNVRASFVVVSLVGCSAGLAPDQLLPDAGGAAAVCPESADQVCMGYPCGLVDEIDRCAHRRVIQCSCDDGRNIEVLDAGEPDAGAPDAGVIRAYCEPCDSDYDCGGGGNYCLAQRGGTAMLCGHVCTADTDCASGARCFVFTGKTQKNCYPVAGSCGADAGAPDAGFDSGFAEEFEQLFSNGCSPCPLGDVQCPPEPSAHCERQDPARMPYCTMYCGPTAAGAGCPSTAFCSYIAALDEYVCLPKNARCEYRDAGP